MADSDDTYCGCLSLRQGSFVVGIVTLFFASLSATLFVAAIIHCEVNNTDFVYYLNEHYNLHSGEHHKYKIVFPETALIALLAYSCGHLVFGAVLVHGVKKSRAHLVLSWLIWAGITFSLEIFSTSKEIYGTLDWPFNFVFTKLLFYILKVFVLVYAFTLVAHHYKNIRVKAASKQFSAYNRLVEELHPSSISVDSDIKKTPLNI